VCIEKISFDLNLILRNIRTLGTKNDNWEKINLGKRKQKDVEFKEMRDKKES